MEYSKLNLVYFSATATTRKTLQNIAQGMGIQVDNIVNHDITLALNEPVTFSEDDIVIVGVPVYSGRIPQGVEESLLKIKGTNTPAIIVCVYGNRDFDDALLELRNIVKSQDFSIISAAAFIAQHSVFPLTANLRPDDNDKKAEMAYGSDCFNKIKSIEDISTIALISVKGNFPYKERKSIPLKPKGSSKKCDSCGTCIRLCPTQAIGTEKPWLTDKKRCISCARCIYVCPQKCRQFSGLIYSVASRKFNKAYAERKEPYIVYAI